MKASRFVQAVAVLAMVAMGAEAMAQGRIGRGGPGGGFQNPDRGGFHNPDRGGFHNPGRSEVLTAQIHRRVRNETLPLRQLLGIGPQYRGMVIDEVIITTNNAGPRAQATLEGDRGDVLDSQGINRRGQTVLRPRGSVEIGEDTVRLALRIDGIANIRTVEVVLSEDRRGPFPPGNGGGGGRDIIIGQDVYERAVGTQVIPLRRFLGIGPEYRGYNVDRVIVKMRSDFGQGQAFVRVNGRGHGVVQIVGPQTRTYEFDLRGQNVIGENVQSLELQTTGNMTIEFIGVALEPQGGGGRPPRRGGRR